MRIALAQCFTSFARAALDALAASRKVDSQVAIFSDQFLVIDF